MAKNKIPTSARYDELVSRDVAKPGLSTTPISDGKSYKTESGEYRKQPSKIYKSVNPTLKTPYGKKQTKDVDGVMYQADLKKGYSKSGKSKQIKNK